MPFVLLIAFLLASVPAAAQDAERLPWFAIDLHPATVGLAQAEGWVPVVSADTVLPGRAWGAVVGATVYPLRLGIMTFGVGASLMAAKGKSDPLEIVTGTGSTAVTSPPTTPVVRSSIMTLAPQLSINFGQKLGWSYLSAGMGRSKVTSGADAVGTKLAVSIPDSWNSAINFGGGARWFMKPHLGAGFDVRFVKLGSRSATAILPSAKRTQMWNISVGISIQ